MAKWQRGVSLIEGLVAALVFSIGVLGVASLNAVSKRTAFEAVQRSMASQLAFALIEQMSTNRAGLPTYLAAPTVGRGSRGAKPAPDCTNAGSPCSSTELATIELWEWEQALDGTMEQVGGAATGGLVDPTACIAGPAGGLAAGMYQVTIVWRSQTSLTDGQANVCGAGTGLYGANNEFRRLVIAETYIDPRL